jgi:predicted alpha/beta hydrolase
MHCIPRGDPTLEPTVNLIIRALDGMPLAAELTLPPTRAPRAAVLVAPAVAVRHGFYRPLARYLADGGLAVLTLDYRGIGQSMPRDRRGFAPRLRDWADLDLGGALAYLKDRFPDLPLTWIGHSAGGQLLGLLDDPPIARALLVASPHAHWRHWPSAWTRIQMARFWWLEVPILVALTGRLPGFVLGGQAVPGGVAREWARWGRDREYAVGFARRRGPNGFDSFRGDLLAYAISDDKLAPLTAVRPLVEAFTVARTELVTISPRRCGVARLGHLGAFRPTARPLWEEWREWLLEAASGPARHVEATPRPASRAAS